jgi:CP family cyanate transporter-like MFS transporter
MVTNDADRGLPHTTQGALTAFVVVLVVTAVNLRPALTTITAALDEVVAEYGLSGLATSVLVTLPVVVFAVGVPIGPWLAVRVGADRAIVLLSALVATSLVVRPYSAPLLFLGTVVASAAITGITVLASAVFRRGSQGAAANLTSAFTGLITVGAAIGALFILPILDAVGGSVPTALLLWAIPAILGTLALAATAPRGEHIVPEPRDPVRMRTYLRLPAAWALILFFGLQSVVFYGVTAWLPTMLRDRGLGAQDAAVAYVLVSVLGLIGALTAPRIGLAPHRRPRVVAVIATLAVAGWLGLAYAPTGTRLLWALLLGLSQGAGFALSLAFVVFRAETPAQAASLSAVVQGVGYAIAATGPLLMGLLLDLTSSWTLPILFLLAAAVLEGVAGLYAGADRPVHDGARRTL